MAIQPIDLQTMYSQMSNVASRVSHEQRGTQMNAAIQLQNAVVQNAETVKTVKKAAGEDSKTDTVKDNGHHNQNPSNDEHKSKNDSETKSDEIKKTEFREDYLGRHIDITR